MAIKEETLKDIEIFINHHGKGRVAIDGVDYANVIKGLHMDSVADKHTKVTLDLMVRSAVLARSPGEVVIDEQTAALLVHLGWTPPKGEDDGHGSAAVPSP